MMSTKSELNVIISTLEIRLGIFLQGFVQRNMWFAGRPSLLVRIKVVRKKRSGFRVPKTRFALVPLGRIAMNRVAK